MFLEQSRNGLTSLCTSVCEMPQFHEGSLVPDHADALCESAGHSGCFEYDVSPLSKGSSLFHCRDSSRWVGELFYADRLIRTKFATQKLIDYQERRRLSSFLRRKFWTWLSEGHLSARYPVQRQSCLDPSLGTTRMHPWKLYRMHWPQWKAVPAKQSLQEGFLPVVCRLLLLLQYNETRPNSSASPS